MENTNNIILTGNLVRDCEVLFSKNGNMCCNFTLAHNRYKKAGEKWEKVKTIYIDCSLWGAIAEQNESKLKKGLQVMVSGKFNIDSWDYQGQKKQRNKIIVDKIEINERS